MTSLAVSRFTLTGEFFDGEDMVFLRGDEGRGGGGGPVVDEVATPLGSSSGCNTGGLGKTTCVCNKQNNFQASSKIP